MILKNVKYLQGEGSMARFKIHSARCGHLYFVLSSLEVVWVDSLYPHGIMEPAQHADVKVTEFKFKSSMAGFRLARSAPWLYVDIMNPYTLQLYFIKVK